eukprot:ANDGO_03629.mRNA.1 Lysosomal beta glucosidase
MCSEKFHSFREGFPPSLGAPRNRFHVLSFVLSQFTKDHFQQNMSLLAVPVIAVSLLFLFFSHVRCALVAVQSGDHVAFVDDDVNQRLREMTLREKIGQMTQFDSSMFTVNASTATPLLNETRLRELLREFPFSSSFNNQMFAKEWFAFISLLQRVAEEEGALPIIYGLDSMHGAGFVFDATFFPQHIGLAATFNLSVVAMEAFTAAKDTAATGISWVFSPVLGIAVQPAWPRVYETFGEDPVLCSFLARAYVDGAHRLASLVNDIGGGSSSSQRDFVATTMKHFAGYSAPQSGKDRVSANIALHDMKEYFLAPFQEAIDAGVMTVMVNSGAVNGVPVHASKLIVTEMLRNELGFNGVVVSDWDDVQKLHYWWRVAEDEEQAVLLALDAGIDMSMGIDLSFPNTLLNLVNSGKVSEDRIDVSVARILQMRKQLGLLDYEGVKHRMLTAKELLTSVGAAEDRHHALEAARESLTLLQNRDAILPLRPDETGSAGGFVTGTGKSVRSVLITGPTGNSLRRMAGGWTIHWQGAVHDSEFVYGTTILEGVRQYVSNTSFIMGVDIENPAPDYDAAIQAARTADLIVLCLGEDAYTEYVGDLRNLELSNAQLTFASSIAQAAAAGHQASIVLVLVEGRPRTLASIPTFVDSVIMAYLPGPSGGQAIADVVFGAVNPGGRLPFTYPSAPNDICQYYHIASEPCVPQWTFGSGLSYSTFQHDVSVRANFSWDVSTQKSLDISIRITNVGPFAGSETVLVFVSDLFASLSPPEKRLRKFVKVQLAVGEVISTNVELSTEDLSFVNADDKRVVEPGAFQLAFVGSSMSTIVPFFAVV